MHVNQQAPYDASACKAACSRNGPYNCAGNFFWHDILWVANPRVPINKAQVKGIQNFWLPPEDHGDNDVKCW